MIPFFEQIVHTESYLLFKLDDHNITVVVEF